MSKKNIKTNNIKDIISITSKMGDNLANQYNKNKDLKVVSMSLNAYKTAISASKTQLIYKKLTGEPKKIKFLE